MKTPFLTGLVLAALAFQPAARAASLLDGYADAARAADAGFAGFSAGRGRALFAATPGTGKPDTPSCTTCHTADPRAAGRTRAGKAIAPMALSVSPDRYADPAKVEKWFRRNCNSVLGRACTAREKGDFIRFMATQ
ncbi:MAG: DUF1924 domain-containing protein [Rhodobacterales bacterium]|nr:DUF1924 domain-containing protein [Rhodobacterales bacterium]